MPPEYEYLNPSLASAQEHVFLINAELERLNGNPLNETKIIKLQDEKQTVIGNIKQDFEMQVWEDGPSRFEEIEKVIEHQFSDETYQDKKSELLESNKEYSTSKYWEDKLQRNLEYYKTREIEKLELGDWAYQIPDRNSYSPELGDLDIEPERE